MIFRHKGRRAGFLFPARMFVDAFLLGRIGLETAVWHPSGRHSHHSIEVARFVSAC